MSSFFDFEISLKRGSTERHFTAQELLRVTGHPELVGVLFQELQRPPISSRYPQLVHDLGGRGGCNASAGNAFRNSFRASALAPVRVPGTREDTGGPGEEGGATKVDLDQAAMALASQLGEEQNLDWYRHVVRRFTETEIRDALVRALEPPVSEIRRSRAALFAHILTTALHAKAHE
jgi:hypothetical protein